MNSPGVRKSACLLIGNASSQGKGGRHRFPGSIFTAHSFANSARAIGNRNKIGIFSRSWREEGAPTAFSKKKDGMNEDRGFSARVKIEWQEPP